MVNAMNALKVNPAAMLGPWVEGFTLDEHISSSEFLGYDQTGRPMFDSTRTQVGEAVYQLKYGSRDSAHASALAAAAAFIGSQWNDLIEVVVPVPPTRDRAVQPVPLVAKLVADQLAATFEPAAVTRTKSTTALKDLPIDQRSAALENAHAVDPARVKGRRVLLFDDLYQSGATMNSVAAILTSQGGASKVYALALTRTKKRSS